MNQIKKLVINGLIQVLIVGVPAGLTGWFSYRSAKVESEAGYKALVETVDKIQKVLERQGHTLAKMQGQVDILERILVAKNDKLELVPASKPVMPKPTSLAPPALTLAPPAEPVTNTPPSPSFRDSEAAIQFQVEELPRDLSSALQRQTARESAAGK